MMREIGFSAISALVVLMIYSPYICDSEPYVAHSEISAENLCEKNVTAKAAMVARLFCCLTVQNRDIEVG